MQRRRRSPLVDDRDPEYLLAWAIVAFVIGAAGGLLGYGIWTIVRGS